MKKRVSFILCVLSLLTILSGCHGSKGLEAFEIPEEFDNYFLG